MSARTALERDIAEAHEALRGGDFARAERAFASLLRRRIPRPHRVAIAGLARRLRRPETALRLLGPVVRPASPTAPRPTAGELAEYGGALIRLGALGEAETLLGRIPEGECALALLFRGFLHIHRWDYAGGLPWLERFLEAISPSEYEYRVAQVNQAACLVGAGHGSRAEPLLNDLISRTRAEGNHLLAANLLELAAQNRIQQEQWQAGLEHLAEAEQLLPPRSGLDGFFLRKWETIARLGQSGGSARWRRQTLSLREYARRQRHWESVRDLDYHLARATGDVRRLHRLYGGTPFPALREKYRRALATLGKSEPGQVAHRIGNGVSAATVDLDTGDCGGARRPIKPGQLLHRLLLSLNSDFYRPRRLAEIHEALYPGQHYGPDCGPNRVYQALNRLRLHFRDTAIPLDVAEEQGFFLLRARPGYSVTLLTPLIPEADPGKAELVPAPLRGRLADFRERCRAPVFRAREFLEFAGVPRRTGLRHLSLAVRTGLLRRIGSGADTRYRFAPVHESGNGGR